MKNVNAVYDSKKLFRVNNKNARIFVSQSQLFCFILLCFALLCPTLPCFALFSQVIYYFEYLKHLNSIYVITKSDVVKRKFLIYRISMLWILSM